MGQPSLDPEDILDRVKARHQVLRWAPLPPDEVRRAKPFDHTRGKSSLDYLHQHWALPDHFDPAVAGSGAKGRVLGLFGRLTYRVLGPYLREERGLLSHLVRVNEALEQRCDDLNQRVQQLSDDVVDRQVAEAKNQAELAMWLHLELPGNGTSTP